MNTMLSGLSALPDVLSAAAVTGDLIAPREYPRGWRINLALRNAGLVLRRQLLITLQGATGTPASARLLLRVGLIAPGQGFITDADMLLRLDQTKRYIYLICANEPGHKRCQKQRKVLISIRSASDDRLRISCSFCYSFYGVARENLVVSRNGTCWASRVGCSFSQLESRRTLANARLFVCISLQSLVKSAVADYTSS